MALDEALLERVEDGASPPILRLYRWQPSCLSLGYSQAVDEVDRPALAAQGWDLVRRPTGGRAILHTQELTYSVILPLDHPLAHGGVLASYRRLSQGLLLSLQLLGLQVEVEQEQAARELDRANPVCFEVPSAYELTVQGKKLIGSAQVRRRGAMLQHGSLPLTGDLANICDVLAFDTEQARTKAKQRLRARAGSLESIVGKSVSWDQASQALHQGFAEAFNLEFDEVDLTSSEQARAVELMNQRYANPQWTVRI